MHTLITRVPSRSQLGITYQVVRTDSGRLICGCPGFSYRGDCRHLSELAARGIPRQFPPARVDDLYPAAEPPATERSVPPERMHAADCQAGRHVYTWMGASVRPACWWCGTPQPDGGAL